MTPAGVGYHMKAVESVGLESQKCTQRAPEEATFLFMENE